MSESNVSNGLEPRRSAVPKKLVFIDLFRGCTTRTMKISDMADWFKNKKEGRLRLPPIQRSLVWRNEQIINYWDSLVRGYPAGMMMVTRVKADGTQQYGRNSDGRTEELTDTDFHLFDGQQRLAALLLGLGEGALSQSLCLWVDVERSRGSGDRLFELRVTSTGQPFGYKPAAPNEKLDLGVRREALEHWQKQNGKDQGPDKIFAKLVAKDAVQLGSSKCAVSLGSILRNLRTIGTDRTCEAIRNLQRLHAVPDGGAWVEDLLAGLQKALDAEIVVKLVDGSVLDESNYGRFFARLGQGGTRLSEEELIYSLIKDRYPRIHDRVENIVTVCGRFASEVDLVLGALRVAQTIEPWPGAKEWDMAGRPTPERFRHLSEKGGATTEQCFRRLISSETEAAAFPLKIAVAQLRNGLLYNHKENPTGLPSVLLGCLPRDLLDVLLLFTFKRGEATPWDGENRATLIAFVLHWLVFVGYDKKAGDRTFVEAAAKDWCFGTPKVAALVRGFEADGIARHAPRPQEWGPLTKQVQERGCRLATWLERFSSIDADHQSGENGVRVLSTHPELQRRALLWLQRRYITRVYPHYDPTSTRDDDLPFDVDHAVPKSQFGEPTDPPSHVQVSQGDKRLFRDLLNEVGNSLGNLRWLSASDNRARGMGPIETHLLESSTDLSVDDHIERDPWNELITREDGPKTWGRDSVSTFQRLIDERTLLLTKMLMEEGGITELINTADGQNAPLTPTDYTQVDR